MANSNPLPPPVEFQIKPRWMSGQTITFRIPVVLKPSVLAIAKCLDRDPAIADKVLQYAQSLVEQSEQNSPDCL